MRGDRAGDPPAPSGWFLGMPYSEASGAAIAMELKRQGGTVLAPAVLRLKRGRPLPEGVEPLPGTSASLDMLRAAVRRVPHVRRLSSKLMYRTHRRFDAAMARYLRDRDVTVVIGYPGAMLETMLATPRAMHVLNMVNGTPAAHNRALAAVGLSPRHQELVPTSVRRRVERELGLAHLVLCPSRAVRDQLLELGVPADRVAVRPYGMRPVPFVSREPGGRPSVLCLGQVGWRKGTDILLAVAERTPEFDFIVVGPVVSPEVLRRLPSNLQMLGEAQQSGVAGLLEAAHVLLLPTREDSFALVVSESLASGLPVVVSSAAGSSEIVPFEAGVVVNTLEPKDYSDALRSLFLEDWRTWRRASEYLAVHGGPSPLWADYAEECLTHIRQRMLSDERSVSPCP